MSQSSSDSKGIDEPLLGLESCPSVPISALAGAQHLLASLAGIIAPTLIITSALGLDAYTASLLSMALVVSGVATWIQSQRIGPFGKEQDIIASLCHAVRQRRCNDIMRNIAATASVTIPQADAQSFTDERQQIIIHRRKAIGVCRSSQYRLQR